MTISIPVFLAAVFIVGFISSFIGAYAGDKIFGSEDDNAIALSMVINVDSNDIDSGKIADDIMKEIEKIEKYVE